MPHIFTNFWRRYRSWMTLDTTSIEQRPLTNRELFFGLFKCRTRRYKFFGTIFQWLIFIINAPMIYVIQEGLLKDGFKAEPILIQVGIGYMLTVFICDINPRHIHVSPARLAFFDTCFFLGWLLLCAGLIPSAIKGDTLLFVGALCFAIGFPYRWVLFRAQQKTAA